MADTTNGGGDVETTDAPEYVTNAAGFWVPAPDPDTVKDGNQDKRIEELEDDCDKSRARLSKIEAAIKELQSKSTAELKVKL